MTKDKETTDSYPDISEVEIDDRVKILFGIAPEGEEVVIVEGEVETTG